MIASNLVLKLILILVIVGCRIDIPNHGDEDDPKPPQTATSLEQSAVKTMRTLLSQVDQPDISTDRTGQRDGDIIQRQDSETLQFEDGQAQGRMTEHWVFSNQSEINRQSVELTGTRQSHTDGNVQTIETQLDIVWSDGTEEHREIKETQDITTPAHFSRETIRTLSFPDQSQEMRKLIESHELKQIHVQYRDGATETRETRFLDGSLQYTATSSWGDHAEGSKDSTGVYEFEATFALGVIQQLKTTGQEMFQEDMNGLFDNHILQVFYRDGGTESYEVTQQKTAQTIQREVVFPDESQEVATTTITEQGQVTEGSWLSADQQVSATFQSILNLSTQTTSRTETITFPDDRITLELNIARNGFSEGIIQRHAEGTVTFRVEHNGESVLINDAGERQMLQLTPLQ